MAQTLLNKLEDYYANLLIVQYNGLPKATATIKAFVKLLWIDMLLLKIRDVFNVDTAVGKQLDIIGQWVGVNRYVFIPFSDNRPWFSLFEIGGATSMYQGGFSEIDDFETEEGGFLEPYLVNSKYTALNDDNFRFLVKLKIIKNSISATCKNIDDAIYEFSNGEIWTSWDLDNRIVYYNYSLDYSNIEVLEFAKEKNLLPCPTPCRVVLRAQGETT